MAPSPICRRVMGSSAFGVPEPHLRSILGWRKKIEHVHIYKWVEMDTDIMLKSMMGVPALWLSASGYAGSLVDFFCNSTTKACRLRQNVDMLLHVRASHWSAGVGMFSSGSFRWDAGDDCWMVGDVQLRCYTTSMAGLLISTQMNCVASHKYHKSLRNFVQETAGNVENR